MATRTVLMCGGPADGRWVTVPPGVTYQDVLKPGHPPVRMISQEEALDRGLDIQETLARVRYRIMPVPLMGHELWVGVCEDEAYDDRAVLRAIFQRDVAAHLGAYR
jgi:hypothetical protein